MKMYDCDICFSAGSVNQWGFCEICGEDFEDTESLVNWRLSPVTGISQDSSLIPVDLESNLVSIGRDAA